MTSDSAQQPPETILAPSFSDVSLHSQIRLKRKGEKVILILPTEAEISAGTDWSDLCQQLKQRLSAGERFWQPETGVDLIAKERLLDLRQLQDLADALSDVELRLESVETTRRQTAVAAATAGYSVEQKQPQSTLAKSTSLQKQDLAEPLYLQTTVRSGVEVRHPGTVIIIGDLNPGGTVIAEGDILVWGRLRGIAHAGASGNRKCQIMALLMEPTQLRIADVLARAPAQAPTQYYPEVA